jgi:1-phosphofructokinase family hexose kinase
MGFAPGGLGRYIEQTLNSQGIPCDFLHTKGEVRTNITILDESRHMNTILSDPGPETDIKYVDELKNRLRKRLGAGDWLVIAGSIPPPLDAGIYTDLIELASEIGAHTVLDADGAALAAGAAAHPEMLKGNRRELERLLGRHLDDEESTLVGARQVHESGVNCVVVTRGREGALAVADDEYLRGVAPRVRAVSAVGSGDAFLAGVVLTLSRGGSMTDALRLGIASGTASVLLPGTELCRRREVDILMHRVRVHPIDLPIAC